MSSDLSLRRHHFDSHGTRQLQLFAVSGAARFRKIIGEQFVRMYRSTMCSLKCSNGRART
jgi:hypothetical protein